MITFILPIIILIICVYLIKNKLVIRIDTFFRKGFKKTKDKYGVYCFCGKQGDGKTYSLADYVDMIFKNKIKICNIESLCVRSGKFINGIEEYLKKPNFYKNIQFIYETDFNKIQNFLENCSNTSDYIVIYDEIFTLIEKGKLSKESLSFLSQMRKRELYLLTTCQEWLELNVTFRRYVRYQIECSMTNFPLFNFAILINRINDAYRMKWDNLQNEYVCPIVQTNIKKCSKKIADSYDTYEVIKTQGKMVGKV